MHRSIIDEEREKWEIKRETMTQCKNCVKKAGCSFFAKRQNCASFEPDKHRHWYLDLFNINMNKIPNYQEIFNEFCEIVKI